MSAWTMAFWLPSRSSWCAQVTVQPEVSRMMVLSSGTDQGSKTVRPSGGQTLPTASVG